MATLKIKPETLKKLRKEKKLSQQGLAGVSGVSLRTIARIEKGTTSSHATTTKRLAKALGVSPEDLSKETMDLDENIRRMGYSKIRGYVQDNTKLAMRRVAKHYKIKPHEQIALAPLLTALLAEGSLQWRKQKLEEARQAQKTLEGLNYGTSVYLFGATGTEEGLSLEQDSIEQRDFFGKEILDEASDQGLPLKGVTPFTAYLLYLARQAEAEFLLVQGEELLDEFDEFIPDAWQTDVNLPGFGINYSFDSAELDRLSGEDRWAMLALRRGHVLIEDIPEHLLSEETKEDRITWLKDQIPAKEKKELAEEEARWKAIRDRIKRKAKERKEAENDNHSQ